jgi:4a-hydroxytetrahydrobiopterin dehydratase
MAMDDAEIRSRMESLPAWELRGRAITRTFRFESFVEAFSWMSSVALVAERMNHHPDWRNVYDRVDVELTTHDAAGLTERDFELAAAMDRLAGD